MRRNTWSALLLAIAIVTFVTAIAGGIGLVVTDGLGAPSGMLANSPFDSYLIPGLILALVVGGTQALAIVLQVRRHPRFLVAHAVAAFGLIIWIHVQASLLLTYSVLQSAYVIAGLAQLGVVLVLLGLLPGWVAEGRDATRAARA